MMILGINGNKLHPEGLINMFQWDDVSIEIEDFSQVDVLVVFKRKKAREWETLLGCAGNM